MHGVRLGDHFRFGVGVFVVLDVDECAVDGVLDADLVARFRAVGGLMHVQYASMNCFSHRQLFLCHRVHHTCNHKVSLCLYSLGIATPVFIRHHHTCIRKASLHLSSLGIAIPVFVKHRHTYTRKTSSYLYSLGIAIPVFIKHRHTCIH